MSFDIFVQCFRNGEPATFKREIFDRFFGAFAVGRREPRFMRVQFPDGSGSDIYVDDKGDLTGMMFNPAGGDTFFDALYQLIHRIEGVVYWADLPPCCAVTSAATLSHIDPELLEGCGPAVVVGSGAEIIAAIQRG